MKTRAQAIKDGDIQQPKDWRSNYNSRVGKGRPHVRVGKTKKDKTVTKCWGNRFVNQQARVEAQKGKKGK